MSEKDNKFIDGLFDAALERAGAQELEALFDRYCDENNDDDVTASKELEDKMFKLIEQERKKERAQKHRRNLLRAVASIVLVIAIAGVSIFSVEAWRAEFFNFVLNVTSSKITFEHKTDIVNKNGKSVNIPRGTPIPSYLPDGFEIDSSIFNDVQTSLTYRKDDSKVIIQVISNDSIKLSEHASSSQETIRVAGMDAYYVEKEGKGAIIFGFGNSVVRLSGDVEKEELIKIAQSMS